MKNILHYIDKKHKGGYILKSDSMIWLLDIVAILIVALPAIRGYMKGFVYACLGFLPVVVSFFGSKILSPVLSKLLRQTFLFDFLKQSVYNGMDLGKLLEENVEQSHAAMIDGMNIPEFLKGALLENNNSVVHSLFQTENLQYYIASYIANICINVMSVVLISVVFYIVMKLFLKALNVVSKLPVISTVNRLCGAAIGMAKGVFVVWFIGIVLTFFYYNELFQQFFMILEKSHAAAFLYHNNLLLLLVLKIFA